MGLQCVVYPEGMRRFVMALPFAFTLPLFPLHAQSFTDRVAEQLRARIEASGVPPRIVIGNEIVYSSEVLPAFYEQRGFRPAWINESGSTPDADSLLRALREASAEGLRTADYHYSRMADVVRAIRDRGLSAGTGALDPQEWADLDLLLTDAFLVYGAHLVGGRVDPLTLQSGWHVARRETDLGRVLSAALDSGRVAQALRDLLPEHRGYGYLRAALQRYRDIEARGGWRQIPAGPLLRPGERDARVPLLRSRLSDAGDLASASAADAERYDETLAAAVKHYQERHGLDADGIIGPATLVELNTTVRQRIERLEVNLERWRWLPQRLGERHIVVNIPGFDVRVMEGEQMAMRMRAVVGRPYRMTPVFSDRMTYLVFSPTWIVPQRLAVEDILPQLRRNPAYLRTQGMTVLQRSTMRPRDPASIDWNRVSATNFPYVLRQEPGPLNALGRVKFMFPNQFNVYLHDSPAQELFSAAARAFSSGCIRIERPLELAAYLLRDDAQWTRERIEIAGQQRTERTVRLRRPIPVHMLYWTAWAEPDGTIHFRPDIYDRDRGVLAALRADAPTPHRPPPPRLPGSSR
jgi:L,D-transpeptidase YcbB